MQRALELHIFSFAASRSAEGGRWRGAHWRRRRQHEATRAAPFTHVHSRPLRAAATADADVAHIVISSRCSFLCPFVAVGLPSGLHEVRRPATLA